MSLEAYNLQDWITGSDPVITTAGTVTSGQNLAQYAPLGQVTATGKFVIWNPAGVDGSEKAVRIAPMAIDASGADTAAQLIKTGTFNPELIAWPGTPTAAQKDAAFVGTPISLQLPNG